MTLLPCPFSRSPAPLACRPALPCPATATPAGLPLPASVGMSYEFYNMFPYNAGIMLANMPTMRRNYKVRCDGGAR